VRLVELGRTGLRVSRLGLGTDIMHAGGITLGYATEIMLRAWQLGVTFIDTDYGYDVLPALAAALPHMERSRLALATKTYASTREGALRDVQQALDALKTEYIDLFLLHSVNTMAQYESRSRALEGLDEAKSRGWVRHVGLSTHAVSVMQGMADHPEIEAVLTVLNLTGKGMHGSGNRRDMEQAIERSHGAGQGVYVMKPFARGRLFDDGRRDQPLEPDQVRQALTYLYGFPYLHSVVPGMRSVQQVEHNVAIVKEIDQQASAN
jgi:aryl-alcohol dehydrogenase-like predicted oxidoreductase